jgi:hypothetical protein
MSILTENKEPNSGLRKPQMKEAGSPTANDYRWDITWKEALGVFKVLSGRRDIVFYEAGPDCNPLGNQTITGLKVFGNDLYIYGNQTGYIVFGSQARRVIREHTKKWGSKVMDTLTILFKPYKELMLGCENK